MQKIAIIGFASLLSIVGASISHAQDVPLSVKCAQKSLAECGGIVDGVERQQCYTKVYEECMKNGG